MTKLSVIIPVYNGIGKIEKTLDSLVEQTVEDFEIIVIDDGSEDATAETVKKYCDDYVDFYYYRQEKSGINAARNTGIDKAKGEYLYFLDCGDIITPDSIEKAMEKAKNDNCDIVLGRIWNYGDVEHYFSKHDDALVVMPDIDLFESNLIWSNDTANKIIKKKIIDLYSIRFGDLSAYSEMLFAYQCICNAGSIGGCVDFVVEKKCEDLTVGYSEKNMPTIENLKSAVLVTEEIYDIAFQMLERKIGTIDGDESYLQAVVYRNYQLFINDFYRKLWFCSDDVLLSMRDAFEKMSRLIKKEKFEALVAANPSLRLPYIYVDKKEAVGESQFSIMIDISGEAITDIIKSLYLQSFPFFEVLIRKDDFESEFFPKEYSEMENLKVIDSDNFYKAARISSSGRSFITLRGKEALAPNLLLDVANTKTLKSFIPYVFSTKRKSLHTRKVLKDKGLNLK